ncbi:histamine H2 receptor-like [Montipora foliosa]|uniref:histamine H2 receptor-like n=1 Tax=Montipora foliosa TaxID=591990 RepID=UPI0035F20931
MNSNITSNDGTAASKCTIGGVGKSHSGAYAFVVFIIALVIVCWPLTTVLNLFVVLSVKRKRRLQTVSNIVLGCLAVTDVIMGAIGMPLFILQGIVTLLGEDLDAFCLINRQSLFVISILGRATFLHLFLMNVERYIAIKHSFKHISMITKSRVVGSAGIAWIVALGLNFPLIITDDSEVFITATTILYSVFLVVMIYCQVVVFCECRRQEKLIAGQQVNVEAREKFLKERKAFKLTTTVLVAILISYLPIFVSRILQTLFSLSGTAWIAVSYALWFSMTVNSLINPIIYCARTRQFRVAFIEILLRKQNAEAVELEVRVFGSK